MSLALFLVSNVFEFWILAGRSCEGCVLFPLACG